MLLELREKFRCLMVGKKTIVFYSVFACQFLKAGFVPSGFADLTEQVKPAVVNIASSTQKKIEKQSLEQGEMNDFFDNLFKEFLAPRGHGQGKTNRGPSREIHSLGSGFLISAEGMIVTNNHVIEGADKIKITLDNKEVYEAKVVGRDTKIDLAVLKIHAKQPLPYVNFADSDKTRVGDWVLAIGNPFGLGGSVTAGIISARGRYIRAGDYDDFLQTDAAINRGNSGGPLFNMSGGVVGINTAIYSPDGGSIGIGFAIPATMAKTSIEQLIKHGKVVRGWLGVYAQVVDKEIAKSVGLQKASGALVIKVNPNSPAEKAGLQQGDVILRFNGHSIDEMRSLPKIVATTQVGKVVNVVVWRNGKELVLQVKIGELNAMQGQLGEQESSKIKILGLTLAPLTNQARKTYNLPEEITGVLVVDVDANSLLAKHDIYKGDVIIAIEQQKVQTPEQVRARIEFARKAGKEWVLMLVHTESGDRFVALKINE